MIDRAFENELAEHSCPHLAVLLRSESELPAVLASFLALGAARNGWLVHRCLPGRADADREALAAAGLDVAALEREERFVIAEMPDGEPLATYTERWERGLDDALARGLSALWYARFATGGDADEYAEVMRYERLWDATFRGRGRPVVTLCPFVVGALDGTLAVQRMAGVTEAHSGVLVPGDGDDYTLLRRG